MDLLRLVLCRQSIGSLERLPKLLASPQFTSLRAKTLEYLDEPNVCLSASYSGELWGRAVEYIPAEYLTARAIFLRDHENYIQFSGKANTLDFWLAIGSGILEVQAKAISIYLAHMKYLERKSKKGQVTRKTIHSHNDLNAIPWTPRLREVIGKLLPSSQFTGVLSGFLLNPYDFDHIDFNMYVGYCKRVLNGEETMEEIPELTRIYDIVTNPKSDAIKEFAFDCGDNPSSYTMAKGDNQWQEIVSKYVILGGYLTHFMSFVKSSTRRRCIVKYAIMYASHISLKAINEGPQSLDFNPIPWPKRECTTRWFQDRVSAILADEELVLKLSKCIAGWYRSVVSGEYNQGLPTQSGSLGIPVTAPRFYWGDTAKLPMSLQGVSYWNPDAVILKMAESGVRMALKSLCLGVDSYRKGMFLVEPILCMDTRPCDAEDARYGEVLAYLRGETETWEV